MSRAIILSEHGTSSSADVNRLATALKNRSLSVKVAEITTLPPGSLDPGDFDIAFACLPKGHTNLPILTEAVMAVIAGSPVTNVRTLVATYSGQAGLLFHSYKPEKTYDLNRGDSRISSSFLVDENSDAILSYIAQS